MLQRQTLAATLLLSALLMQGCAAPAPHVIQAPRLQIPSSLLAQKPRPQPPADPATDKQEAGWIVDLAEWGGSCYANLKAVGSIVKP